MSVLWMVSRDLLVDNYSQCSQLQTTAVDIRMQVLCYR